MPTWSDLSLAQAEAACREGRVITRGPLNDTYAAHVAGRAVFVRHRTVDDPLYGQTFVAERFAAPLVAADLQLPEVLQVVSDREGRERYGIFEFIQGGEPDWTSPGVLSDAAQALAAVHRIRGEALGNLGGDLERAALPQYLGNLVDHEISRLPDTPDSRVIRHRHPRLSQALDCFADESIRLCHGDVHAANWLQDQRGRLWLLDWEAARFRAAAADFNQLHEGWLSAEQQRELLHRYLTACGRDLPVSLLQRQILVLRFLWHLRTYNFQVRVRRRGRASQRRHLVSALDQLDQLDQPARAGST